LAIAGSPRKGGNTQLLLQEAIRGLREGGAETLHLILGELRISPCQNCGGCFKQNLCIIQDEMQPIYSYLRELDILIVASPIFFCGLTAQTKGMMDRCQALWALRYIHKQSVSLPAGKKRWGFFISVSGMKRKNIFRGAIQSFRCWLATLEIQYRGSLLFPGVDEKGEILKYPEAMEKAYQAGIDLASTF